MKFKGKNKIKFLIAAGILSAGLSGCKTDRDIKGYVDTAKIETSVANKTESLEIGEVKKILQEGFSKSDVILDEMCDEFISSITIDGTNVSVKLSDESIISGTLHNLTMSDISLENFYVYDSKYMNDYNNVDEKYSDYKENGYASEMEALRKDYEKHHKLELSLNNCSVNNEYKRGYFQDIKWYPYDIDYSNCKKIWLDNEYLRENQFSLMPNLETLILESPRLSDLDEESIKIQSNSLKNLIIDGNSDYSIDYFDFSKCPNLEILSLPNRTQATNLSGLKGLKKLKQICFSYPPIDYINEKILDEFEERIDLVSKPFPTDSETLCYSVNNFISDISGINGSEIECLNISFLKRVNSDNLLETVKSLHNLKQIIGFEINNSEMCSDELIEYCEEHGIEHPFTEKSLEIKHKLMEIVSNELTYDMDEEEKVRKLSEYIVSHMKYNHELINDTNNSPEKIKKGWGEALYYSVIEGSGVCEGYSTFAQSLFTEAGITTFKIDGVAHTWNLVQIDDGYYFVDLTNVDVPSQDNESNQLSFEDYNWDSYYLIPVDEEWKFNAYELPIEAEKIYDEAKEKRKASEKEENKLGKHMLQAKSENLSQESYSKVCSMIGVQSALGLAKSAIEKLSRNYKNIDRTENLRDGKEIIKLTSLKEAISTLKRFQKLDVLRNRRDLAGKERIKNQKAKDLEKEVQNAYKEPNLR